MESKGDRDGWMELLSPNIFGLDVALEEREKEWEVAKQWDWGSYSLIWHLPAAVVYNQRRNSLLQNDDYSCCCAVCDPFHSRLAKGKRICSFGYYKRISISADDSMVGTTTLPILSDFLYLNLFLRVHFLAVFISILLHLHGSYIYMVATSSW